MSRLRSPLASLCVAALAVATASVVLFAAPQPAGAATRTQVLNSAYAYGRARGYHVGIAVLDTKTGATYHVGDHAGTFASESVVKVMIATRVYLQGRLKGATAKRVYTMITQSDDQIASDLYGSVGGDHLITWIKKRFALPHLGSEPRRAGWWGNTHITPDGMVALYGKIKKMPRWGAWLINAMHHATKHGSDGFYQWFGLKSANKNAAIKQGWGTDYDNWGAGADENTTGYVNGERYAIAILARGPARTYGNPIGAMLTATAKRLLPGGVFPDPYPVLTSATARHARTAGHQVVGLRGQNLSGASYVYFGATRVRASSVTTSSLRVTTPAHAKGLVRLRVVTGHGTSTATGLTFEFVAPPTATSVTPTTGKAGQTVTIHGANFVGPRFRALLGTRWVSVRVVNSTTMTFSAPAGLTGTFAVRPSTVYGTAGVKSATFTYVAAPPPAPKKAPVSTSAPSSSAPSGPATTQPASTPTGSATSTGSR